MTPEALAPLPTIEAALADALDRLFVPGPLLDAVRYAVLGGGKRIRPLLCWHAAHAADPGPPERALPACVAVEFVHAFSLVHDDLPALDNDDLRRGRPTLHRHAGEAAAILAGDALLNAAFRVLGSAPGPLAGVLADATHEMVQGQVYDTLADAPGDAPIDRLRTIHALKTGALIRASCELGARIVGADPAPLVSFGTSLGLLFQIVDDLLDAERSSEEVGKRTGKDAAAGKLTYPGLLGPDGARAEARRVQEQALAALAPLGPRARVLSDLTRALGSRTR